MLISETLSLKIHGPTYLDFFINAFLIGQIATFRLKTKIAISNLAPRSTNYSNSKSVNLTAQKQICFTLSGLRLAFQ